MWAVLTALVPLYSCPRLHSVLVVVQVISARRGEFETGFERGGQTREHAMLVKTAGVKHLVVAVNKMDDPTVQWDEERWVVRSVGCVCEERWVVFVRRGGLCL